MSDSTIRFSTFPRTESPPGFVEDVVDVDTTDTKEMMSTIE
jgi:hypothetical protein